MRTAFVDHRHVINICAFRPCAKDSSLIRVETSNGLAPGRVRTHLIPHKGLLMPSDAAKAGTLIRGDFGTSMTMDLEVCAHVHTHTHTLAWLQALDKRPAAPTSTFRTGTCRAGAEPRAHSGTTGAPK